MGHACAMLLVHLGAGWIPPCELHVGLCCICPPVQQTVAPGPPPALFPPFRTSVSVVRHGAGGAAAPKAATAVEEGEAVPQPMLGKPFVEVQWEMLHHNPSILYFRALLLQIQVCSAACPGHLTMWSRAAWLSAALRRRSAASDFNSTYTNFLACVSASTISATVGV